MASIDAPITVSASGKINRVLLWGGVVGPLLFMLVFLIEQTTRPGYDAVHEPVSSLDLSGQGWEQIINFLVCGVLVLGFSIALRRVLRRGIGALFGPIFLGIFSLGLLVAGAFTTDPDGHYPPGLPIMHSGHGVVHGFAGLVVFVSLPVACFVLARRFAGDPAWKGWALYSVLTGLLIILCFASMTAMGDGRVPNAPGGLLERVAIIAGWAWIVLVAWRLLRQSRAALG